MIKKGMGPNPTEKPATKPKLAMTEISRQEYTMPRPRNKLMMPIVQILQSKSGFRPLRSIREAAGKVVARFMSEMMREISADDDGNIDERTDVE
jgi:hypothetical protein